MKTKYCIIYACLSLPILTGCLNDDYLEKYPLDKQTEITALTTSKLILGDFMKNWVGTN